MERRSLFFVALLSITLFGFIIFFAPKKEKEDPSGDPETAQAIGSEDALSDGGNPKPEVDSDNKQDAKVSSDEQADEPKNEDQEEPEVKAPAVEHQFFTIGSLAEDSPYKMLITLNNHGASVTRVELNERLPNKKLRYRNIDDHSGYIGQLLLVDTGSGMQIRVVGTGTPAALATCTDPALSGGLKAGDTIISLDGVNVSDQSEYDAVIKKTKPKAKIQVRVVRNNKTLDFDVALTNRPSETIRPETDEAGEQHPESFLTSVRKFGDLSDDWQELDPSLLSGNWTGEKIVDASGERIVFTKRIRSSTLKKVGFTGEVLVKKTYSVTPAATEENKESPDAFHFNMEIAVEQIGGDATPQEISLQINGPTGAPSEGWWYTNKIHGEATAVFKTAGARDVILSTEADEYKFISGPDIFTKATSEEAQTFIKLFAEGSSKEERSIKYAGIDAQYFTVSMIPDVSKKPFVVTNMYVASAAKLTKEDKARRKLVDATFRMYSEKIELTPGTQYSQSFQIFAGPKEPELLSEYKLDDVRSFGWFAWCSKGLLAVLHVLYFFVRNYGLAIILLTVIVRLCMTPISRKAALNAQMMQMLQPEMKKITEKYKDDLEKRGQKQRELFKRYNYNPMGGCLLMFFQLPIFMGLYRALNVDIALRDQPLIPGIQWCSNLAGPDQMWYWKDAIPLPWLTGETGFLGPWLNILPLVTVVLFLVQQKLFTPPPTDEQQAMTQKMMTFMMLFMGFMFFKVPAGLCIYFITSSLWGICERKLLPKPVLDKSKFDGLGDDTDQEDKKPEGNKPSIGRNLINKAMQRPPEEQPLSATERKKREKERQRKLKDKKTE